MLTFSCFLGRKVCNTENIEIVSELKYFYTFMNIYFHIKATALFHAILAKLFPSLHDVVKPWK